MTETLLNFKELLTFFDSFGRTVNPLNKDTDYVKDQFGQSMWHILLKLKMS